MSFREKSRELSRRRPETYDQYKQEKGADLRSGDLAHYFNSEMHLAVIRLEMLKTEIERSITLESEQRKQMLDRIQKIEIKLDRAHGVANDTFQVLGNKEEGQ